MARPKLDGWITEWIENYWTTHPADSAAEIHRQFHRTEKGNVSLSKVRKMVSRLKKQRKEHSSNLSAAWKPWKPFSEADSPDETDYLLELRFAQRKAETDELSIEQAKWAKRIRISLKDLPDLRAHAVLSLAYAVREGFAKMKGRQEDFHSDDLDGYLAYKPWLSDERRSKYDTALIEGTVPYPAPLFLGPSFRDSTPEQNEAVISTFGLPFRLAHNLEEELRGQPEVRDDLEWILSATLFGASKSFFDFMSGAINGIRNEDPSRLESDTGGEA